jgi:dTDP-4-amino-4,6-dideoxygalactose transaminase
MVTDNLGPGSLSDRLIQLLREHLQCAGGIVLRERSRALAVALAHLNLEPGSSIAIDPLAPWYYDALIRSSGLVPHYVDLADDALVVDTEALKALVANPAEGDGHSDAPVPDALTAILLTAHCGYLPDLTAMDELGVPVIEDVTEGIGSHDGRNGAGSIGRFVLVGMEPDAMVTSGGGTALLARSRGDRNSLRHEQEQLPSDALLSDMNAALGITQVRDLEKYVRRRAEIADAYRNAAMRGRHRVPVQAGDGENAWPGFPVMIDGSVPDVVAYARKKGVEAVPAFRDSVIGRYGRAAREADVPDTDDPAVQAQDTDTAAQVIDEESYPNARKALLRCVLFPLYPSLSGKEVSTIERVIASLP